MNESIVMVVGGESYTVYYTENPQEIVDQCRRDNPAYVTYDTETSGLHLKKDKAFVAAICWDGVSYVFPTTAEMLIVLEAISHFVERIYAHNTLFDMNMTANIIGDDVISNIKNWGDSMGVCRFTYEALSPRDGGDKLKLKLLMDKYVDPNSSRFEKNLKEWMRQKIALDRKLLIAMLKPLGWGVTRFEDAMNHGKEPIPQEVMDTFHEWRTAYPEPTYMDVPKELMLPYVAVDAIGCNILVRKGLPVVAKKQQMEILNEEFDLMPEMFDMSRIGIKVDRPYLEESRERLTEYMEYLERKKFQYSNGKTFRVGQHKQIKDHYEEVNGVRPKSSDKQFMNQQKTKGDKLASVISKLRTLEKWRSTYIDRILEGSEYDGRFYATLDQFNPITGRFSGNLQQQPKHPLKYEKLDDEGDDPFEDREELFHSRKGFLADVEEDFDIFLMDFSQVELRFQAHYTLPFGGDINLCRAYMPFKCIHRWTDDEFDYMTEEGRARWNDKLPTTGESVWIVPETGQPWKKTDVHSASTQKALGLMGIDYKTLTEKEFEKWRGTGKGVNFAKNYGVGIKGASEQFAIELHVAKALCNGYDEAFPMVITYQNAIVKALKLRGFVTGAYGRRYYLKDERKFYKAANYVVQGSCAHDLKKKMKKIADLLRDKKSAMLTCIHDEIIYRIHRSERYLIPILQKIMEHTPIIKVPIVSDIDWTSTNWADKHKYEGEEVCSNF